MHQSTDHSQLNIPKATAVAPVKRKAASGPDEAPPESPSSVSLFTSRPALPVGLGEDLVPESSALVDLPNFPAVGLLIGAFGEQATIADIAAMSDDQLRAVPGIGPATLKNIRAYEVKPSSESQQ